MCSILTVIEAATNRRLATEAALRAAIGSSALSSEDAQRLIREASALVEAYCGRTLVRETVREVFRSIGAKDQLILARRPVASVVEVLADGVALSGAEYEFDPASAMVWRLWDDRRRAWSCQKVSIEYAAGYLPPDADGSDMPGEIQRAAVITAAAMYSCQGRDPLLRSETTEGVGSNSWLDPRGGAGGLPASAADALSGHRTLCF